MIYDIIGDIHGQAGKLVGLLTKLGYQLTTDDSISTKNIATKSIKSKATDGKVGYYKPPVNHRAIFIGDLIDRGEQEVRTLEIVFAMLDADVADAVMGNHEYNAMTFATLDKSKMDGSYLRPHKPSKVKQHQAFLAEVAFDSNEHKHWISRFYELPLWIETEHACFVHACWDEKSMAVLSSCLTDDNKLTESGLQATGEEGSDAFIALEQVLKGVEATLPNRMFITDQSGTKRHRIRVKWWLENLSNYPIHEVAQAPKSDKPKLKTLPEDARVDNIEFKLTTDKPIFIGHYWMDGMPVPLSEQVVCTDYSAAIDNGYLTCYQLDTDNPLPLSAENFVQFNHHTGQ